MKNLILITLTVFSMNCFSQTGAKNFIDQNFIEVTGKAEMEIVPNEIYLKIIVNEKDFKGKQDLDEIEKLMTEKLTEIGIDISKKLAIKDMVSNLRNYWLKSSTINSIKKYQLTVDNAKTAGQVFQGLESLGISNISIERIEHSEIQKFKTEVKILAIKAAKEKAISLTNAIDQNIGKAIYIQELNNQIYRVLQGQAAGLSNIVVRGYSDKLRMEKEPEIEFEKIKLEYSILVRFEINE
ncbi:MAG: SIMPL domain-containing protein [Bacteroidales bacterium]|nr:SIMPL domain-containing protein [Bacteroidales bacterium]